VPLLLLPVLFLLIMFLAVALLPFNVFQRYRVGMARPAARMVHAQPDRDRSLHHPVPLWRGGARRTSEIGLRMALGAGRGAVIWMVLREVCVLAAIGLAIGVPTALGTSRLIESFLFEIKPNDPRALTLAAVILLTAALMAGYGPARRASRVDPMIALRHE
jgi:FtsX-like permease family